MRTHLFLGLTLALVATGCQETPDPVNGDAGLDAATNDAHTEDADRDAGADDAGDASDGSVVVGPTCTLTLGAGPQNALLCPLSGPVRHVRVANVSTPAVHASAQVFIGLPAMTGSQTPLGAGQFKLQIYGGGTPAPDAEIDAYFGPTAVVVDTNAMFVRTPTTLCFDIHDGSESTRAAFVLWHDGANGADCEDRTTLTLANAVDVLHAPSNGALTKDQNNYYYQGSSVTATPTITLFDTLAVPNVPQPPPPSCSTSIATTATSRVVELCDVEGEVEHVRITGLEVGTVHNSAQVLVGFDTPPSASSAPPSSLAADQWKVQLYGGGPPSQGPSIDAYFGTRSANIANTPTFLTAGTSEVCFDLHDGSATTPPYFVLWRDGENGADCEDFDSLTLANAYGMELAYGRTNGALDKDAPLYFYQTTHTATPTVTVFNTSAVTPEEAAAGLSCTTTWASTAYWQQLCMPAAGRPRHVRIEDAQSLVSSKYFYLILNEPTAPVDPLFTGAPTAPSAGDGRFVFTGGLSHVPASASYFRFNGGSSTQYAYTGAEGAALYSAPHDVCMDFGTQAGGSNLRVLFWATGAGGANCEDVSTLTVANALYDSTTAVADTFYGAPLGTTGLDFIKISGSTAGATLGNVVLFREPAVY